MRFSSAHWSLPRDCYVRHLERNIYGLQWNVYDSHWHYLQKLVYICMRVMRVCIRSEDAIFARDYPINPRHIMDDSIYNFLFFLFRFVHIRYVNQKSTKNIQRERERERRMSIWTILSSKSIIDTNLLHSLNAIPRFSNLNLPSCPHWWSWHERFSKRPTHII